MFEFIKKLFIKKSSNAVNKLTEPIKSEQIEEEIYVEIEPLKAIIEESISTEIYTKPITPKRFSDKDRYFDDYSHLTPSQARREMKERKDYGEWLEFKEYGGYMNAINAEKEWDFISKIEAMTPEQTEKWFSKRLNAGYWITDNLFEAIGKKLKPFHEELLLTEMDTVTIGRIEGWVNARKKQGYFFSDVAYQKANKILSGEIENRKIRKSKKKP